MRSAIISIFRKVVALALIFVIGMTSFTASASAYDGSYENEKEPFAAELAKDLTITAVTATTAFLAPPAICLAADALATAFFPPAAALAPYCASMGLTAGGAAATATAGVGTARIAQEAMAH
jgi:hypothetical protein